MDPITHGTDDVRRQSRDVKVEDARTYIFCPEASGCKRGHEPWTDFSVVTAKQTMGDDVAARIKIMRTRQDTETTETPPRIRLDAVEIPEQFDGRCRGHLRSEHRIAQAVQLDALPEGLEVVSTTEDNVGPHVML